MIAGLLGRLFVAAARFTPGEAGTDLAHVGEELRRLEARHAHPATSSR